MKHLHLLTSLVIAATCVVLSSSCSLFHSENTSASLQRKTFPDNTFQDFSNDYVRPCAKAGTIEKFTYKTRDNQHAGSPEFEKYALVYLPYGYNPADESQRYDVLYLMHGGAVSQEWYFGGAGQSTVLKNMIDRMIEEGKIKPLIICAVSFYTPYCNDATKNCIDFHYELNQDLIPVFEKKYHTFAKNTTQAELNATRGHRAFSGYSMGACATWAAFEYCLDEMAYFLPMSGDCWAIGRGKAVETAKYLEDVVTKNGKTAADFKIYAGCGGNDVAEPNLTPLINEMKKSEKIFKYSENFANGNLYQCLYKAGGHDLNTAMRLLYNGLPKMFD